MGLRQILAGNLRRRRRALGMSQEELAHRAEIDRTYVSAIERSVHAASVDVIEKIAEALAVDAPDLLRNTGGRAPR